MELAIVTGIGPQEWERSGYRGMATALDVLEEQAKAQEKANRKAG